MSVILNEVDEAKNVILRGEVGNKPTSTLFLLSKYYRSECKLNAAETIDKLNCFMEQNFNNYNSALWEDIIENIVKKTEKLKMRKIKSIGITQNEINIISSLNNIKYEKLLFSMLCFAKLYNTISTNNNSWINTTIKELFKVSRVTVRYSNDKFLYLNDIAKTELISFSNKNDNLNIRVMFCDTSENYVLNIYDFSELGFEYLNYLDHSKFIKCKACNKLVRKTNNKCLYCNKCAKEIKNKQNKKYYQQKI